MSCRISQALRLLSPNRDTVPIKHFIQSVLVSRAKCSLNPDLFGEYPDSVNVTNRTIYDELLYQYTKYHIMKSKYTQVRKIYRDTV